MSHLNQWLSIHTGGHLLCDLTCSTVVALFAVNSPILSACTPLELRSNSLLGQPNSSPSRRDLAPLQWYPTANWLLTDWGKGQLGTWVAAPTHNPGCSLLWFAYMHISQMLWTSKFEVKYLALSSLPKCGFMEKLVVFWELKLSRRS